MPRLRLARLLLPLLCSLVFAAGGCAHYHLGTGTAPAFTSLYLAPVQNRAGVSQATAIISTQLREAFLRDGRIALATSPAQADAVLTVTLISYGRETLTALARDTGLARKLGLTLEATASLTEQRTGRVLFAQRPLHAVRQAFTDSGQLESESDAMPLLAEQLGQAAAHSVLDRW
ncbi:MAG: LPS assembly lipoprotein LptE [Verrucomicrobiota bacterium]